MAPSDWDHKQLLERIENQDRRFGNLLAYCKRLEKRIEILEEWAARQELQKPEYDYKGMGEAQDG